MPNDPCSAEELVLWDAIKKVNSEVIPLKRSWAEHADLILMMVKNEMGAEQAERALGAAAGRFKGVVAVVRKDEDLGQAELEVMLKAVWQTGFRLLRTWVTQSQRKLRLRQLRGQVVLTVMIVLRNAGWHVPKATGETNEAGLATLFKWAARLDSDNTWWATPHLKRLAAAGVGTDQKESMLEVAYRLIFHLTPVYFAAVCCDDRGTSAAAKRRRGRRGRQRGATRPTTLTDAKWAVSCLGLASEVAWRNADIHVDDGDGFLEGVDDTTPWRVFCSLAQGGRMGILMVPDTRTAVGGGLQHTTYCKRVAHLVRFLAHSGQFHFVSKDHVLSKLTGVFEDLVKGRPGIMRSGISDFTGALDVNGARAARPSAAWISFDGKAPPTPVQPLPVGSRIEAVERAEPVFGA